MKLQETFTKNALECVQNASILATANNQRLINGDNLFRGTYAYIKQLPTFEIFANIIGLLPHIDKLDAYFDEHFADLTASISFGVKKSMPFNKRMQTYISELIDDNANKIDFVLLFYIAFTDLSSATENYAAGSAIPLQNIHHNCEVLLKNKAIQDMGTLAFLHILSKMFHKLHLHPKNVTIMQIDKWDAMNDINMVLDAVESDILDNTNGTAQQTGQKEEEKKLTIEYFGTDLTKEYKDGYIDPIIGREKEIDQMIYTLLRKNKNNPLLIGEAGVGKTAIVEGLAQKIVAGQVPEKLKGKRIFMLDMGTVVAGTKYRGEFEARFKTILEEATDPMNNIILFIDELHTIIGAGGQENNDAAQMIKPLLARGKVKLIGATTFDEYQKHIEKDAALKRRFQEIHVEEPDAATTLAIIQGLKKTYEDYHGVQIQDDSIALAIKLSTRYILNKHLPDKALDIIDEACARKSTLSAKLEKDEQYHDYEQKIVKLQESIQNAIDKQDYFKAAEYKEQEETMKKEILNLRSSKNIPLHLRPVIEIGDIGVVLSDKLGIPASIVTESEIDKLKRLRSTLDTQIIGQDESVEAVVKSLTRSRLSVVDKNKPIGSFLFLGPTGVGKTYLAKLIAKEFFGDEKALIRIDMSEFMEKFSVSKLIGSPAGYVGYEEGGNLTESVRRKPYSVVLFDEIEKASPDVLNILLQILDEGHLKDSKGRIVDFKSTIIIMTSNLGAEEFSKKQVSIGFADHDDANYSDKQFEHVKERVMHIVKDFLSPELLNRIDKTIVFKPLSKEVLGQILHNKLGEFLSTWKSQTSLKIPQFPKKKVSEIIDKIYDPAYGARPLDRYIHDEVEPQLIEQMMQ